MERQKGGGSGTCITGGVQARSRIRTSGHGQVTVWILTFRTGGHVVEY